jgi:hypothetical protein
MGFAVGPGPYSVGAFFVSCCLQTGHGLVITYVISLRLLLKIRHPGMHVYYHRQVLLQHFLFKAGKCRGCTRTKFGDSVCAQY